ncbi:MAG TPA: hypothetical protein PLW31_03155 [Bacteroidales bacterium]|mgnify:FL=1|nr:hypothetical protein [Bacteroidales bacterium]
MIRSVIQYDSVLVVLDENGNRTGTLPISGAEYLGYANNYIVLRYGNMIVTVDENQRQLGNIVLPGDYVITGITNNGFLARTGRILQVYDPYCNHIGIQSI